MTKLCFQKPEKVQDETESDPLPVVDSASAFQSITDPEARQVLLASVARWQQK